MGADEIDVAGMRRRRGAGSTRSHPGKHCDAAIAYILVQELAILTTVISLSHLW